MADVLSADGLQANPADSLDFLRRLRPQGPWVLTSIDGNNPQAPTATRTFAVEQESAVRDWIARQNQDRNVYFTVAELTHAVAKKAKREHVSRVSWLHVDLDPRPDQPLESERARILQTLNDPPGLPKPTAIVDSGGGYQAFWRLVDPIEVDGDVDLANQAGLHNRGLCETLGAIDSCHSVDHLMRLPGTVNHPNAKKRAAGRSPRQARLMTWTDASHPLLAFPPSTAAPAAAAEPSVALPSGGLSAIPRVLSLDELGDRVSMKCKATINMGHKREGSTWPSRSEALLWVCCELVRSGVDDAKILAVITDPDFAISESVLEKKDVQSYAVRQVETARRKVREANQSSGIAETSAQQEGARPGDPETSFDVNEEGTPYGSARNVRVALNLMGITLAHDDFADRALITGLPGFGPVLQDAAVNHLWILLEEKYRIRMPRDRFWSAIMDKALQDRRHPVRKYLDEQQATWDRTARVDRWLIDYFGVEDSAYVRAVSAIVLIAAVRRARRPGCKFDEMLVLEGPQGNSKSTGLAVLAVNEDWFSDDLPLNAPSQKFLEQTNGRWIVEAAEMTGHQGGDLDAIKAALSRTADRSRMAYGRLTIERPRQFIIIGTTNAESYLKDSTGNRRFWPVRTTEIDLEGLKADRDQLWGEAAFRESQGEDIRLPIHLYDDAGIHQSERRIEDPMLQALQDTLGTLSGKIRAEAAWTIVGIPPGPGRTQQTHARLVQALRELGFERKRRRFDGGPPEWSFARGHDRPLEVIPSQDGRSVLQVREPES